MKRVRSVGDIPVQTDSEDVVHGDVDDTSSQQKSKRTRRRKPTAEKSKSVSDTIESVVSQVSHISVQKHNVACQTDPERAQPVEDQVQL